MDRCYFPSRFYKGMTLPELMIVVAIVGMLVSIAVPSFRSIVLETQAASLEHMIFKLANSARVSAIYSSEITIICPLDELECGDDWNEGMMVFTDKDNNRKIDEDDTLLEVQQKRYPRFEINWQASGGRNFLRFSPTGMAREFGRFHVCHSEGDATFNRALVVNRQGRLRRYTRKDKENIVTDANGEAPYCP